MNVNCRYLKDENGNIISPVTSECSVYDSVGISLQDKNEWICLQSYGENENLSLGDSYAHTTLNMSYSYDSNLTNNTSTTHFKNIGSGKIQIQNVPDNMIMFASVKSYNIFSKTDSNWYDIYCGVQYTLNSSEYIICEGDYVTNSNVGNVTTYCENPCFECHNNYTISSYVTANNSNVSITRKRGQKPRCFAYLYIKVIGFVKVSG